MRCILCGTHAAHYYICFYPSAAGLQVLSTVTAGTNIGTIQGSLHFVFTSAIGNELRLRVVRTRTAPAPSGQFLCHVVMEAIVYGQHDKDSRRRITVHYKSAKVKILLTLVHLRSLTDEFISIGWQTTNFSRFPTFTKFSICIS